MASYTVFGADRCTFEPYCEHILADSPAEAELQAQWNAGFEQGTGDDPERPLVAVQVVAGRVWVVR